MYYIAIGHYFLLDYDSAVQAAKAAIQSYPDHPWATRLLAAALAQAGYLDEAQDALRAAIAISPKSFERYVRRRLASHRPEDYEHLLNGLRKAGWQG
jgi:adenylate cyclase